MWGQQKQRTHTEQQMVSKMTDFYCHLTILGKRRGVSKKKYSFQSESQHWSISRRTQSLSRENPMKSKEEEGETRWGYCKKGVTS